MNSKEFFNSMAEKWDKTVYHDENKIKRILEMVKLEEGSRILDVGTGTGVMVPFLLMSAGSGGRIIAVDMAEKMIEAAKSKFDYENVGYIVGDILQIEMQEDYFDCIMCYSIFPHFEDRKAEAVLKLASYLKKKGKMTICHSQSREAINNLHKEASETVKNDRLPSADVIKGYFEAAGLDTVVEVDSDEMFVLVGCKR